MSKNTRNRILLTALAALLLVVVAVGGTMAWLVDTTDEVKNTFTTAGIDIDLTETLPEGETTWSMQMIPGTTKAKNPTLTVNTDKTDIPIWLFVKVDENGAATYLEYDMILDTAEGWTTVTGATDDDSVVYVYEWEPGDPTSWALLLNNTVKVRENLVETGDTISGGIPMPANGFNITFQAYAIQKANHDTALDAWNAIADEAYN